MSFQGRTALHEAAYSLYDNSKIVKILLDYGCKPDEKDDQVNRKWVKCHNDILKNIKSIILIDLSMTIIKREKLN